MPSFIKNIFKGIRKYLNLFTLSVIIIIIVGLISPKIIEHTRGNWEAELSNYIKEVDESVNSLFMNMHQKTISKMDELKKSSSKYISGKQINYEKLSHVINRLSEDKYSIEIMNENESLVCWSKDIAIPLERFFPLYYKPGVTFFFRSNLITYFCLIDTMKSGNIIYYYAVSLPVQKHYKLLNDHYKGTSLTEQLNNKFKTGFKIEYTPLAQLSRDGREHSLEIKNNISEKIGVVTYFKPALDTRLNTLKEQFSDIQAIAIIFSFIFLMLSIYVYLKKYHNAIINLVFVTLAVTCFRYILFYFSIPTKFIEGQLTNSSYFASSFGYGIVKSPADFFISVILILALCIYFFENVFTFSKQNYIKYKSYLIFIICMTLIAVLFLIFLRGLGASMRSIVFDSSLRYFKEPELIPKFPITVMQFNILLLGLASVIFSTACILILSIFFPYKGKRNAGKLFFASFLFFQAAGFLYDYFQKQPQGTSLIRIIYISLIFIIAYKIYFEDVRIIYNYIYFALVSSIATISLLNYYNSQIERESLKTTANEITRPNDNWLRFIITETLTNAVNEPDISKTFVQARSNYESAAFIIWSNSFLQNEKLNSSITLLDRDKNILGSFGINIDKKYRVNPSILNYKGDELTIFDNFLPANVSGKIISGIIPVKDENILLGYITISILFDPEQYRAINYPPFLSTEYSLNRTVEIENLKIFEYRNGKLSGVFGEVNPPNELNKIILNSPKNLQREAWLNFSINDEEYVSYVFNLSDENSEHILAVALKEKDLSWSVYNFLKVFFIHIIFISVFLLIIYIQQLSQLKEYKFTFRSQLLISFLLISLIPLVLLAIYNRELTERKNSNAVLNNLKEKAQSVRNYLAENLSNEEKQNSKLLYGKASSDLDINYSVYSGKKIIYSSNSEFNNAGLFQPVINPEVYIDLNYKGYKEAFVNEKVEDYSFNNFYYKTKLGSNEIVLQVDDLFNKVTLPITGVEVDVIIFGSYSIAIILVIIFSAFLANRISSPIRRLTKATESVASGDLTLEINSAEKGEVKDLINGFNYMIKELKRSQSELAEMEREIAWKEMARQVAHEIKNPLTPMKLAVQQLVIAYKDRSEKFDTIFNKVAQTIISQIETLNNIASEFSSFARMPKLKLEKVNVIQVAEETMNLFLEEKIKIILNHTQDHYSVMADKDQLKRTFINLIRNSMQAGASKVEIKMDTEDNCAVIEFIDDGIGIPKEYLHRIFEENFTTKAKGMGLGLKMAKKFIEGINGSIKVSESNQSGTKILLRIPKS